MSFEVDNINDKLFLDSPDAGENCICSRCNEPITYDDMPFRVFVENEKGVIAGEYRYHFPCAFG